MTSKLQVTVPKALAQRYGIEAGSEIAWEAAGDAIRVLPPSRLGLVPDLAGRLALFDAATARQKKRRLRRTTAKRPPVDRGWTREELYGRGATR